MGERELKIDTLYVLFFDNGSLFANVLNGIDLHFKW